MCGCVWVCIYIKSTKITHDSYVFLSGKIWSKNKKTQILRAEHLQCAESHLLITTRAAKAQLWLC